MNLKHEEFRKKFKVDILKDIPEKRAATFGKWKVSIDGTMNFWDGYQIIDKSELAEDDWIIHFHGKAWIDWNEFIPAYIQALKNAEIKHIGFRIQ